MNKILSILTLATIVACNSVETISTDRMGQASFKISTSGVMTSNKESRAEQSTSNETVSIP